MMDSAAKEPPHHIDPEKRPYEDVDAEKQRLHSPVSMAAAVSKVLDDDKLLIEILLRVGFPTTLVHAALACKRWLHHASTPAFLRQFGKLHRPRLLGIYLVLWVSERCTFCPHSATAPELDCVFQYGRFCLDTPMTITHVTGCRNGSVLINFLNLGSLKIGVHKPLCPERDLSIIPPLPRSKFQEGYLSPWKQLLYREEGGGLCYIYVWVYTKERTKYMVEIDMLQNGDAVSHNRHLTLPTDQLHCWQWEPKAVLMDNKIYIPTTLSNIVVFDLTASCFSMIQFPQGVEYGYTDTVLAWADDASDVYLINAKMLQLRIWLHKGGNWFLVHTICLREMCANLSIPGCEVESEPNASLRINHVGDCADFVLLEMDQCILFLDIKCRQLHKVYDMTERDESVYNIHPFMMIWPPIFPALKDDPARNTM